MKNQSVHLLQATKFDTRTCTLFLCLLVWLATVTFLSPVILAVKWPTPTRFSSGASRELGSRLVIGQTVSPGVWNIDIEGRSQKYITSLERYNNFRHYRTMLHHRINFTVMCRYIGCYSNRHITPLDI